MRNGYAYRTFDGSVYFDVNAYGRYGKLWTHKMDTEIRESGEIKKRAITLATKSIIFHFS